jgi:hypothetical protein
MDYTVPIQPQTVRTCKDGVMKLALPGVFRLGVGLRGEWACDDDGAAGVTYCMLHTG